MYLSEREDARKKQISLHTNSPPPRWWSHQLANRIEQGPDALIVACDLSFEIRQSSGQFLVKGQWFAQPDEGAHDGKVEPDCPRSPQSVRPTRQGPRSGHEPESA